MSTENENLFEGIQLLTPEELNSSMNQNGDTDETSEKGISNETPFEIVPVTTETGETETSEEDKSKPPTNSPVDEAPANEQKYKALISELHKAGIITSEKAEKLEELKGDLDTIKELLSETVEKTVKEKEDSWKKNFTGAKKRFLEIEDAFTDSDTAILVAQRLEFLENIDQEKVKTDVNLQKNLYHTYLKDIKNFTDEEAAEAIADAEAIGKLEKKSLDSIPELTKRDKGLIEQSRLQKEELTSKEIEAQDKAFEKLINSIEERESFVEGLNLNKTSKEKLKNNILNPVYKDEKTGKEYNSLLYKQFKNPTEFEMLINYYDTLGLFNITKDGKFNPDISKLKTVAKTQAVNELDKILSVESERGVGRNTSMESSAKTEDILNTLSKAFGK